MRYLQTRLIIPTGEEEAPSLDGKLQIHGDYMVTLELDEEDVEVLTRHLELSIDTLQDESDDLNLEDDHDGLENDIEVLSDILEQIR
jgi:hypothetical protein